MNQCVCLCLFLVSSPSSSFLFFCTTLGTPPPPYATDNELKWHAQLNFGSGSSVVVGYLWDSCMHGEGSLVSGPNGLCFFFSS